MAPQKIISLFLIGIISFRNIGLHCDRTKDTFQKAKQWISLILSEDICVTNNQTLLGFKRNLKNNRRTQDTAG